MRAVQIIATYKFLAQMLALPEGSEIRLIWPDRYEADRFHFIVEHPDLPEMKEGLVFPKASITYRTESGAPVFDSWQIED